MTDAARGTIAAALERALKATQPPIKPTVHELEKILSDEDTPDVVLNPDGSVSVGKSWADTVIKLAQGWSDALDKIDRQYEMLTAYGETHRARAERLAAVGRAAHALNQNEDPEDKIVICVQKALFDDLIRALAALKENDL